MNKSEELLWLKTRINILNDVVLMLEQVAYELYSSNGVTINKVLEEVDADLYNTRATVILLDDDDVYDIVEYDEVLIPLKSMKDVCLVTLKLLLNIKFDLKNSNIEISNSLNSNIKFLEKLMFASENALNNVEKEKKKIVK